MTFSDNAMTVLQARYLRDGETPEQRFHTVARAIASAYDDSRYEDAFYQMMIDGDFLANTPTLANGGRGSGQLAACFVMPIADALTTPRGDGILDIARSTGLIFQTGGGVGFDFSAIRPAGSPVRSSNGVASGPVSFISLIDSVGDAIKQGGIRRGATMAELNVGHPDIRKFIASKNAEGKLVNFNVSVSVPDAFMDAVREDGEWPLVFGGVVHEVVRARELWQEIAETAWKFGDPGVIFLGPINRDNPLRGLHLSDPVLGDFEGTVVASNPCGEIFELPWESCTLGSINLGHFFSPDRSAGVDYARLAEVVQLAVRFLDDVVDVNKTPLPQIDRMTRLTRRIGLGVMGWADLLNSLRIPYDSKQAVELAVKLGNFIRSAADEASHQLANERGTYSLFQGGRPMRNIARLSIAPTGSISTIADCSAGIEPYFAREVLRKVAIGELRESYANADKPWFRTAMEIDPIWHVRHQAAWQQNVDNAVSKTINMPNSATPLDVREVYEAAYRLGCKGITIYRDGSRDVQVYHDVEKKTAHEHPTVHSEGCESCPTCGWSVCVT